MSKEDGLLGSDIQTLEWEVIACYEMCLTCLESLLQNHTSWYDFAKEILNMSSTSHSTQLLPIPTSEYPTPATRPLYSLLSNDKLEKVFGFKMPHWNDALKDCMYSKSKN